MNCICGAFINSRWQHCLICGLPKPELVLHGYSIEELEKAAQPDWEWVSRDIKTLNAFANAYAQLKHRQAE